MGVSKLGKATPSELVSVDYCLTATAADQETIGRGARIAGEAAMPSPKYWPGSISVSISWEMVVQLEWDDQLLIRKNRIGYGEADGEPTFVGRVYQVAGRSSL